MDRVRFPVRADAGSLQGEARERALGLQGLRSFLTVAQTGHLGRAARDLKVSQPAISLRLRKLEEGLGTQLLLRHARGITLTSDGACLRDRLHTVLQMLASPLDEAAAETAFGKISLAIPAESGAPLVAPLARIFRARWPELTLEVKEGDGSDLEEWVLHRHVDLAILQDHPPSLAELETSPLFTEALGLIAPVYSALARDSSPLPLRELVSDLLILPDRQHGIRRRLDFAAQQCGVLLKPVLQVNSVALTKVLVRSGLGYAILPLASVHEEVEGGALAFRPIGQPALSCTRVMAFHRAASNALVAKFAGMVRDAVIELASDDAWPGAEIVKSIPEPMERERKAPSPSDEASQAMEELAIQ